MKDKDPAIEIKLKKIVFPFMLWCLVLSIGYPTLAFFFSDLIANSSTIEEVFTFYIPLVLVAVVIGWYFRGRIEIVKYSYDRMHGLLKPLMCMTTLFCLIFVQDFLEISTNKLAKIDQFSALESAAPPKYFTVTSPQLDRYRGGYFLVGRDRISRDSKNDKDFTLFVVTPASSSESVWLGSRFHIRLSMKLGEQEINRRLQQFIQESRKQVFNHNLSNVQYYEVMRNSAERGNYIEAVKRSSRIAENEVTMIKGHRTTFSDQPEKALSRFFTAFIFGNLILLLLVIFPAIDRKRLQDLEEGKKPGDDLIAIILPYLNLRGLWPATAFLLLAQIFIYLYMVWNGADPISPTAAEITVFGGQSRDLVNTGEDWRLFSSMFLHYGIMHLAMNLFFLGIFGRMLEEAAGPTWLIVLFVAFGLSGSIASHLQYANGVSAGASGAIYGLAGILLIFVWQRIVERGERLKFWLTFAACSFSGILAFATGDSSVGHAAHAGGFFSGLVLGFILCNFFPSADDRNRPLLER